MNTLVPLPIYTDLFHHFNLVICIIVFLNCISQDLTLQSNYKFISGIAFFVFLLDMLYMGLRPISYLFGDMIIYYYEMVEIVNNNPSERKVEYIFQSLMEFFAGFRAFNLFFFICSILYIIPLYVASKRFFQNYWGYAFLMLVFSFTFWAYGVNGIRNGIAASLFILGLSESKSYRKYIWFIVALFFHKSMILPLVAFIISNLYRNIKVYYAFWLLTIPVSLVLGNTLEGFFLGLGLTDDHRLNVYLGAFNQANEGVKLKTGFRWDFILFSGMAVISSAYFIFKEKIKDALFQQLTSVYLLANGFWILIIRANYSNRFAYLSWFIMGIILIYPFIKYKFFEKQNSRLAYIILFYFLFGYFLNVVLV